MDIFKTISDETARHLKSKAYQDDLMRLNKAHGIKETPPIPESVRKGTSMTINSHYIDFTVDMDGYQSEHEAEVRYEYHEAERGSRERGSGIQLEPDYPESVEILKIICQKQDIMNLFSDRQIEVIQQQILGD